MRQRKTRADSVVATARPWVASAPFSWVDAAGPADSSHLRIAGSAMSPDDLRLPLPAGQNRALELLVDELLHLGSVVGLRPALFTQGLSLSSVRTAITLT